MSKNRLVIGVAAAVLLGDQWSKWWIEHNVPLYASIPVFESFFHISHVRNSGGAFSLLAGANDAFRIPFFLGASAIAIAALVYFIRQIDAREHLLLFSLAGVLGGALGNLTDRLVRGQVTDFLDLHWHSYHWPAFNVADSFITVGVCVLVVHSFVSSPPHPSS
jgi:signal peptidase II